MSECEIVSNEMEERLVTEGGFVDFCAIRVILSAKADGYSTTGAYGLSALETTLYLHYSGILARHRPNPARRHATVLKDEPQRTN